MIQTEVFPGTEIAERKIIGIHESMVQAGSAVSAELTVLDSFVIPANLLKFSGDSIEFEYTGTFDGGDGSQVFVFWDTGAVFDSGAIRPSNTGWVIRGRATRTGAATQKASSSMIRDGGTACSGHLPTADLGGPITLEVRALGTLLNAVLLQTAVVNFRGVLGANPAIVNYP